MQAIEDLRRLQAGAKDLLQVVRTMRAIAVASVREFQLAEDALALYESAVAQGLALALSERVSAASTISARAPSDAAAPLGIVALGSDHGLVGRYNETLAQHVRELVSAHANVRLIVLGARLAARLDDLAPRPEAEWSMPRTAHATPACAGDVLLAIEEWQRQGVDDVMLVYNVWTPTGGYAPLDQQLLPLDLSALTAEHPWPRRTRPLILGDREAVADELLEQFLSTAVSRALTRSLLAENEARLAATRGAEHNIEERIDELRRQYRHAYQGAETEELLDVVAGFEAITRGR